jgi:hypothetical protein
MGEVGRNGRFISSKRCHFMQWRQFGVGIIKLESYSPKDESYVTILQDRAEWKAIRYTYEIRQ